MLRGLRFLWTICFLCFVEFGIAQSAPQKTMPAGAAIDEALVKSSLTYLGKPFHAAMDIDEPKHPGGIYKAHIDLYWTDANRYRLETTSKDFSQTLIANGGQVQETDIGDFYPKWLREFVWALLDPAPHANDPALRAQDVKLPNNLLPSGLPPSLQGRGIVIHPQVCATRVDRPNGISNLLAEGEICIDWSDQTLKNVQWFEFGMGYSEPKKFGQKMIPTKYSTLLSTFPSDEYMTWLEGRLTKLEPAAKIDQEKFKITHASNPDERILTMPVSTLQEESMLESAPQMDWPVAAHGVTEGYLIVHAVTDRTGQVRSAWRVSADNSWMEPYAMTQALKYKFKPLLVDGAPVQMEMPLVMHFKSAIDDSMPRFSGDKVAQVATGCESPKLPSGLMPSGTEFKVLVFVNEAGKSAGFDYDKGVPVEMQRAANEGLYGCEFVKYEANGVSKPYHVEFSFTAP
jgi:hypothetical protein